MTDPISAASSRLFGAGAPADDRLIALKFLGVLMENADPYGRVRADPDDLVGLGLLHEMEAAEVDRARRWLESVSMIERRADAWVIRDFEAVGSEVPPAAAMDAIARALGRPMGTAPDRTPASPTPASSIDTARRRRTRRWGPVVPAAVVAAAAVAAVLVAGPASLRLPSQTASNVRSSAQGSPPTTAGPGTVGASPEQALSSPPSSGTQPGQTDVGGAPASVSASSPPTTFPCPVAGVAATVEQVTQDVDQSSPPTSVASRVNASLPALVHTTVDGVVRNDSGAAATVDPFPVDVTFAGSPNATSATVTGTALDAPATIPAHGILRWSVSVDGPPSDPRSTTADARLGAWHWTDPAVAAVCPASKP